MRAECAAAVQRGAGVVANLRRLLGEAAHAEAHVEGARQWAQHRRRILLALRGTGHLLRALHHLRRACNNHSNDHNSRNIGNITNGNSSSIKEW